MLLHWPSLISRFILVPRVSFFMLIHQFNHSTLLGAHHPFVLFHWPGLIGGLVLVKTGNLCPVYFR